jgi:hypothetical protein
MPNNHRSFYWILNSLFHVVHIAVILFVMFGWLFSELRLAHLVLVLLTLSSWFILGQWQGVGYCPISDLHWKVKGALGTGRPTGSYIQYLLQRITRKKLNPATVDKAVLIGTVGIAALSIVLNGQAWFG